MWKWERRAVQWRGLSSGEVGHSKGGFIGHVLGKFEFPQGLKPNDYKVLSGRAEQAAEKVEKQIPRGLKPARNDKSKGLVRRS